MTTNFALASIKAAGGTTSRTLGARCADVVNVKDYGALGDGVANDGPAIQAAFDAAFGTSASPHGTTNKALNRQVIFPAGHYLVGAPLYLTNVDSGIISGSGMDNTTLSYTGSLSGNTVAQGFLSGADIALVRAITPLIITQGFAYSKFENINLSIHGANTTPFYLFWNGQGGAGPTANIFSQVLVSGSNQANHCTDGFLIGYLSAGLCSEQLFLNCAALYCDYGFRNISNNALNNRFVLPSAALCNVGISSITGNIVIDTGSFAANGLDIENATFPITVLGCRTESANFIDVGTNGQGWAYLAGNIMSAGAGAGAFVNIKNSSIVIMDSCQATDSAAGTGLITGDSQVHIRGCDFRNTGYLSTFTGVVRSLDIPNGLVSALPTANARYKGLRALVTDASATTFMSTVAGSGSNIAPVICDGTNWKIG